MKLLRLTLHGFKSFADRTELRFHEGITAVVGPNGCGKSNISDAIRWALGEQRPSAIRGAKMEEAIFQGTAERRGVSRAEVALVFSNEEGRLSVPYDEIEIRRTIFREGGSEYQLNRTPCRLRDILDLCRDTGLGAAAYAVIEQRMVDAILSDRADERRQLFEEAAGVGRYKDRRRAAQRRLESSEADLARLEDLISEVESKVRGLARQRRRAQRYEEMRARRLALEVTLAAMEIEALRRDLDATTARLDTLERDEPGARAELSAAETELERRRLEAAEAARTRNATAARLEDVGRRIAERDRELAVAEERRAHAERRLAQMTIEREELRSRVATLETESTTLETEREAERARVEALAGRLDEVRARVQALRDEVAAARREEEQARRRESELVRGVGAAEAAAATAAARAAEHDARLRRLEGEREEIRAALEPLDAQNERFAERSRALSAEHAEVAAARAACAERLDVRRAEEADARRAYDAAADRATLLAGQVAALEALERAHDGFRPVVAAALDARDRVDGLLGPLADFLDLPPERAAHVESALGSLLQLLVVRDAAAAAEVVAWLEREAPEEGVLALLPESLLSRLIEILDAVRFAGDAPRDAVLLGRRERLAALREEAARAARERDAAAATRAAAAERIAAAEAELRDRDAAVQSLEAELRRVDADEAAWRERRGRLQRSLDALDQQHAESVAAGDAARAEIAAAHEERARLEAALAEHRAAWQSRTEAIPEREAALEAAREEEAELRVTHARAEAALAEVERRLAAARSGIENARQRTAALDREEIEHRKTLEQIAGVRADAGAQLEDLFRERETLTAELRTLDERLSGAEGEMESLEARVRTLRRAAEERAEERHRLELLRAEGVAGERSIRERLEAEWGRPFEQLVASAEPIDGTPDALRAELQALAADIERLGPINMLAIEEHEEERRRFEFLTSQRDDLLRARDDLRTAIRQINRTARALFLETFEQVRVNFQRTFGTLFEGGVCDVWLADPDDPLESGIEISAAPKGKRTQQINLLSGGERALTSLALLFAIYLVKPSPFCVLDEVDAPLDEANIGRFVAMLQEFKAETQFIVITHNPRTMEAADWIYGVTMEDAGVSTIVGVQLDEVLVGTGNGGIKGRRP
ncbi:MAG TPA: AAA family ATPase [Longimicrobiales bacterium]